MSAIDGGGADATSIVDSSPRPAWIAALEVEEDPRVGGLLEVELLDLDLAVARGRLPVDPVHASPGAYGRTVVASGVVWSVRSGEAWLPSRLAAGSRQRGQRLDPRVDDHGHALADRRRRLEEPERVAGPDVERLDPEVAAPRQRRPDRATTARCRPPERDRPARAAPPGSVVGLWISSHSFGIRLRVAQRVGHAHPVADVAVELADRVARLEVGQPEPDQDVATRR